MANRLAIALPMLSLSCRRFYTKLNINERGFEATLTNRRCSYSRDAAVHSRLGPTI